jgi:hypothetical protein
MRPGLALLVAAIAALALPAAASAETLYVIDNAVPPLLATIDSATPTTVNNIGPVTGMAATEQILAMDFRPADGQLYGVTNLERLYRINAANGAATMISQTPFTPTFPDDTAGADFDPVHDVLRVTMTNDVNVQISPVTGQVINQDANLTNNPPDAASDNPTMAGLAFTNNFPGATSSTLYGFENNLRDPSGSDPTTARRSRRRSGSSRCSTRRTTSSRPASSRAASGSTSRRRATASSACSTAAARTSTRTT